MSVTIEVVEEILPGGTANAGLVRRVGDTVRRPSRPTSETTRALLDHLQRVGFDGAPRYLGTDHQGREVLSYIPGHVLHKPHEGPIATDASLASVARLVRRYHNAVACFDPDGYAWPQTLPDAFRDRLVCHNDLNPSNVVFDRGEAVALIDFDLASPGCAGWDLAGCMRDWIPLGPDWHQPDLTLRTLQRLELFVDTYGATAAERERLFDALLPCHDWCSRIVQDAADAGHPAFRRYWLRGEQLRAECKRLWLSEHAPQIRKALSLSAVTP